ncbi:MAG TPA: hypothetical protein VFU33_04645 [Gaiellaceae bacterium]|nr:hypothetical protein [Gaiellaceae bacterium]
MRELKPVWKTSSFLVYLGGLTVLVGGLSALGYLSTRYPGGGARTAWALLVLVVLWFLAESLRRAGTWVAAGIFAFITVIAWGYFVGSAWDWFGWLHSWGSSAFGVWSLAHLSLEFLVLLAAIVAHARWRFPFIALISSVVLWFFITDFISNGGWWTYTVSLFIGLVYFLGGSVSGRPSAFWLHFVGGLLIGVPILHWFDSSNFDFAVVLVVSLLYVLVAYATKRSSWAVFGSIGFFIATIHYALGTPTGLVESIIGTGGQTCVATPGGETCTSTAGGISAWSIPLALGLLGLWLVFLGLLGRRRRAPVDPAPA